MSVDYQRGCLFVVIACENVSLTPVLFSYQKRYFLLSLAQALMPLPLPVFVRLQLCDICLAWLGDTVFSIRVAATDNLKRLANHFGTQWARDYILPKVATFVPTIIALGGVGHT